MQTVTNEYVTKDFYSGSILKAMGFPLERVEKGSDRFSLFVFSDPLGEADEVLARYWKKDLMIQGKILIDSIRDLKTVLYSK